MRQPRFSVVLITLSILCIVGCFLVVPLPIIMSTVPLNIDSGWCLYDAITPTLDTVIWREEGFHEPSSRLMDGRWYERHCDHFLVHSDYSISAFFFERFNWTAVNAMFSSEVIGPQYTSFVSFYNQTRANPAWWLEYSWQLNIEGMGISEDTTLVTMEYNDTTAEAHVRIILKITNVPGYFLGYLQSFKPILYGFDVSEIYLGQLHDLRWSMNETPEQTSYKLHFEVGARLMEQRGDTYSFHLWFYPQDCSVNRSLSIMMPVNTEIYDVTPSTRSSHSDNVAFLELMLGDDCPEAVTVLSGPPIKEFTEILTENMARWLTEPEIWAAIGGMIILGYGTWTGRQMWSRRKTYYRLYRSMVRVFDNYADDPSKFHNEIADLSKSITEYFIDGRINDEQFDTLLTRRDDLVNRVIASKS